MTATQAELEVDVVLGSYDSFLIGYSLDLLKCDAVSKFPIYIDMIYHIETWMCSLCVIFSFNLYSYMMIISNV